MCHIMIYIICAYSAQIIITYTVVHHSGSATVSSLVEPIKTSVLQSVTETPLEHRLEMSASDILLTQLCRAAERILHNAQPIS